MSDKFLNTGGSGNANITNGTINAFVAGITVANLKSSMPIKTNSVNSLVSTKLDIADINNLESTLENVLTNPFNDTLTVNGLNCNSGSISNVADPISVQDVSTKNYVDTAIAAIPTGDLTNLETKTQNISLADTTADTTVLESDLVIASPTGNEDITAFDGQGADLAIDGTSPGQLFVYTGFEFTAGSNLSNVRFKIKSSQRSTIDTSNRFIYVYEYNTATNSYGNSFAGLSIGTYGNALLPPIIEGDYNLTYPYQLSLLAGKRYALLMPLVAGDKISQIGPSPITVDSNISVIGSVRLDAAGNFPASTNDGYSPILTLEYDVSGLFKHYLVD